MVRFFTLLFLLCVVVYPTGAHAHGQGFTTFLSTTTEGYIIDVDWESLAMDAGVSGTWAFRLYRDGLFTQEVPYKDLWVRIVEDDGTDQGKTIFAGPIAQPEFGYPRFLYVFPEEGKYTLAVRYNRLEDLPRNPEISAEFSFFVTKGPESTSPSPYSFALGAAAGAAAALILGFLILRIRKKH